MKIINNKHLVLNKLIIINNKHLIDLNNNNKIYINIKDKVIKIIFNCNRINSNNKDKIKT